MNKAYFENALRNSGIWQIYKWQTLIQDPEELERTIVNERWRELGLEWLANQTAKKHYRYLKTCIKQERED